MAFETLKDAFKGAAENKVTEERLEVTIIFRANVKHLESIDDSFERAIDSLTGLGFVSITSSKIVNL